VGALREAGLRVRTREPTPYPGIELPDSFERYLEDLPRKRRKDLRRHVRRLDEGSVELRHVTATGELRTAIDRWQDIRVRWWRSRTKAMDPEHGSERFRDFVRDMVVELVPQGLAEVWELRHEGELVGVEVNLMDATRYYSWMGAYEPAVAHLGLGKLAIGESIRASIAAGPTYYDLMVGDEEYKYWYGATDRYCRWMMVGSGRPVSRIALAAGAVADRVRRL
jgi:CelD/BcsL family acetyltransferase involved in cellulose biosynthesis